MNQLAQAPEHVNSHLGCPYLKATPFIPKDPSQIPARNWLHGNHLIRKNVSVTVAPGGVGKSSLTIVQALELATGRQVLGHSNAGPMNVWIFNLEDERLELERRIAAAQKHHQISDQEIGDRLFLDTGREQELILANQLRDEVRLETRVIEELKSQLLERSIDVLIIDPFVSSHRVNEMDNGKIDIVAKQWIRIAEECNCAIELVHHTRKLNGIEASTDASRGASSLINAARSARVLQRLSDQELEEAGVAADGCTYFSVKRDKSNLAKSGGRETYRTVSVDLGQGDQVGVVEAWRKPRLMEGFGWRDLQMVQEAIDGRDLRYSEQAGEAWAGHKIAEVLCLDPRSDKRRLKKFIEAWLESGALKKVTKKHANGKTVPVIEVGNWACQ